MDRINRILKQDLYQEHIRKINEAEADRRFCHHNMAHFLDVARISMIINLEEGYGISREMIYAAALLHDIGRWKQYEDGTPHEAASAGFASEILIQCGFTVNETDVIIEAIKNHRNKNILKHKDLSGLIYRGDKASRTCFCCEAESDCDWKTDKKNLSLSV